MIDFIQFRLMNSNSLLYQQIIDFILTNMPKARPTAYATARYVGAQNHEARKADEQSKLVFLGHQVPLVRSRAATLYLARELDINWETLSEADFFNIWYKVWEQSEVFEIKSIALYELKSKRLKLYRHKNPQKFFKLVKQIDNWAHSDELSSIIADIVENDFSHFEQLQKWNKASNPWLRRQSQVGIYFYARLRKKLFPASKAIKLVESLLDDKHFYVQRAVGWTLREIDRVDPVLQRKFVKKHLRRISPVAWFATSELYSKDLRLQLVKLRK